MFKRIDGYKAGYQTDDGFKALWGEVSIPEASQYHPQCLVLFGPDGDMLCCVDTLTEADERLEYWRKYYAEKD